MLRGAPNIRVITFDLDDTLWDIWATISKAEEKLHDWLAVHYPRIAENYTQLALRGLTTEVTAADPSIAHDRTIVRKRALKMAAHRCGYLEFMVEPAFEIFFAARNEVIFFEEVKPALARLHGRFAMGALTNGNADLGLIGLDHLFDFSLNAIDVGVPKPEAPMFEEAIRLAGVPPAQILHVGDDPEHDVIGARRAGMRTCWVNRAGRFWPGGPRADVDVATLEELETVLGRWNSHR